MAPFRKHKGVAMHSEAKQKCGSLRIEGCIRQHSCSFHVQNLFLARLRLGFSGENGGEGRSLNAMEQNSFFDNDIKGDGCFCVWSGACLKCSEDSGVVGQVHRCFALGMIISCDQHGSLKQLSVWHVNNDLPFSPADAKQTLTPKYPQFTFSLLP